MLFAPPCENPCRARRTARISSSLPSISVALVTLICVACGLAQSTSPSSKDGSASAAKSLTPKVTSLSSSLRFEPNRGQTDARVKFLSRSSSYNLFLTDQEAVFAMRVPEVNRKQSNTRQKDPMRARSAKESVVRMRIVGARPRAVTAADPVAGISNYFIGNDPRLWVRNVPQYARVKYDELYPGIDMTFYGSERSFEFDVIVKPGANPQQVALQLSGARNIRESNEGTLLLTSDAGHLALHKPIAYQVIHGERRSVDARFVARGRNEFGFALGKYDPNHDLVIDPTVLYSTYLGGSQADLGFAIAVDAAKAIYVTGQTASSDFPGATTTSLKGSIDAFVTKLNPNGTALVYSTYLGGANQQGGDTSVGPTSSGNAIAIDSAGDAYVAGGTNTSDFPLCPAANNCPNPAQGAYGGGKNDAIAVKLDPTGNLAYSTFIGGSDIDVGNGIAIDASGNIYVGGQTNSSNLPVVQPLQALFGGDADGFIAKIDGTSGSPTIGLFKFLDYLGGSGLDNVTGIALDGSNNIYVGGITGSTDFPVKGPSPYQTKCGTDGKCNPSQGNAQPDAFFAAIKSNLSQYIYSTYFGGSGSDSANNIVVDSSGNAYIAGFTSSTDLQVVNPYQQKLNASAQTNVLVAELDPTGSTAEYVTYLGGSTAETALSLALDSAGRIYLTGQTSSVDFPLKAETQNLYGGSGDAFVSQLDPSKTGAGQLVFSTFLGGPQAEDTKSAGIAIDSSLNIYVTGDTASPQGSLPPFPIANALQPNLNGAQDAFVTIISSTLTLPASFTVDVSPLSPGAITVGSSGTSTVTLTSKNSFAGNVNLSCAVTPKNSNPPTCTINPITVALSANGTATATLTIGTTAPTSSVGMGIGATWLPVAGLALLVPVAGRKRRRWFGLATLTGLTALLLMPGCVSGSGPSGGGGGGSPGTTKGTYHFTVTAGYLGSNKTAPSQEFAVQ